MVTKRQLNSMISHVVAAMPAIPYIMRSRRRTPIGAYILGGLGLAMVGGLTAVMLLSPRTRHRALDAAKGTYGKVNQKVGHLRPRHKAARREVEEVPVSNGLAPDYGTSTEL